MVRRPPTNSTQIHTNSTLQKILKADANPMKAVLTVQNTGYIDVLLIVHPSPAQQSWTTNFSKAGIFLNTVSVFFLEINVNISNFVRQKQK